MLLSKTAIVKWHYKTKDWYESKGYNFTKYGDEFEVKVENLQKGSNVYIEVKCDCEDCKNPYLKPIVYNSYINRMHKDGKYYCQKCAKKLFSNKNLSQTLLIKHGKSFYSWCIEHNRQDVLDRWDYELNKCSSKDICFSTKKKYYFKCSKGIHPSELKNISNFIRGQEGSILCKECNSVGQYLIDTYGENALDKYWDYEKNNELDINPYKISCNSNKKIWIKCQNKSYHDSYNVPCLEFVYNNSRCPYCASQKVHPLDSLGKLLEDKGLLDIWSNKNKKSPYTYSQHSGKKVWWKCSDNKHEEYYSSISNCNISEFRCPECVQERDESILQEKVRLYLESLNNGQYTILHEFNCTIVPQNPKIKDKRGHLPFDNEIEELKLIIEVHGKQHYQISNFHNLQAQRNHTTPKYELHMQQVRDRYKRFITYKQGYEYLEIPYWTDDKNETYKQLINNKIKEILK